MCLATRRLFVPCEIHDESLDSLIMALNIQIVLLLTQIPLTLPPHQKAPLSMDTSNSPLSRVIVRAIIIPLVNYNFSTYMFVIKIPISMKIVGTDSRLPHL